MGIGYQIVDVPLNDCDSPQEVYANFERVRHDFQNVQGGKASIDQTPHIVSSKDELWLMMPDDCIFFVFGSIQFTGELPNGLPDTKYVCYLNKANKTIEAHSGRYLYTTQNMGTETESIWTVWATSSRTIPQYSGVTRDGAILDMVEVPSMSEILDAEFVISDSPEPDATTPPHYRSVTFHKSENEYDMTLYRDGIEWHSSYDGTSWSEWNKGKMDTPRYFDAESHSSWDYAEVKTWIEANIPNYQNVLYTIEFADIQGKASVSPTGKATTHYNVEVNKQSDGSCVVYATITSDGTDEYPVGTMCRNVITSALVPSGWVKVSMPTGVLEVVDATTVASKQALYENAITQADGKDNFTIVFDSVTFTSEKPNADATVYWCEVIKTSDRSFMRASCSIVVDGTRYNYIYYSALVNNAWSNWTLNAPVRLGDVGLSDEVTEDSTDETVPTSKAVYDLFSMIYPIGAIALGTCPSVFTWQKVTGASGKALWGSDTDQFAGTTINAGLPNIVGEFQPLFWNGGNDSYELGVKPESCEGAFTVGKTMSGGQKFQGNQAGTYTTYQNKKTKIDASRSSSIYGNSTTVQPPAYVVDVWERIS